MNFNHFFLKKCNILTPDIRKQPQASLLLRINLNGKLWLNKIWPIEGAMYITLRWIFRGHPKTVCFMQFSQNIEGFWQNGSQGLYNSYNFINKPMREHFHFHYLPKLYIDIGFKKLYKRTKCELEITDPWKHTLKAMPFHSSKLPF